ncbi:MAG: hypothetical protein N4A47_03790 [Clostridia bacterium]|jgi:hypothetical protein|nr:hypothetical protein [Clostridia bacterium]
MLMNIICNPIIEEINPRLYKSISGNESFVEEKVNKIDSIKRRYIPFRFTNKLFKMGTFYIGNKSAKEKRIAQLEKEIRSKLKANIRFTKDDDKVLLESYEMLTKDGIKLKYEIDKETYGAEIKVYRNDEKTSEWNELNKVEVDKDGEDLEKEIELISNPALETISPKIVEMAKENKDYIAEVMKEVNEIKDKHIEFRYIKELKTFGKYYVGSNEAYDNKINELEGLIKNLFKADVEFSLDGEELILDRVRTLMPRDYKPEETTIEGIPEEVEEKSYVQMKIDEYKEKFSRKVNDIKNAIGIKSKLRKRAVRDDRRFEYIYSHQTGVATTNVCKMDEYGDWIAEKELARYDDEGKLFNSTNLLDYVVEEAEEKEEKEEGLIVEADSLELNKNGVIETEVA